MTIIDYRHRYLGPLTAQQIADGMNAAQDNAHRLITDAELLFNFGRYPTALSIATLALEETAKNGILRRMACCRDEKERKAAWRDFRRHGQKNLYWTMFYFIERGLKPNDAFAAMFGGDREHSELLSRLKETGLYVDFDATAKKWLLPAGEIPPDTCKFILDLVKPFCRRPTRQFTAREIELWQAIICNGSNPKQDTILWHKAMIQEGMAEHDLDIYLQIIEGEKWPYR